MNQKKRKFLPEVNSSIWEDSVSRVPSVIRACSGIKIQSRRIKSFLFSTDVATITYSDADAILAVYPQSPHPSVIEAISLVASQPVFAGVSGGSTAGARSAIMAQFAEARGVMGVIVNSPTDVETIKLINKWVDCPIIATVVSFYDNIDEKLEAGADILNVANGSHTPELVIWLRDRYPKLPIIATGGPNDETIQDVIEAGANAVSWKPPTTAELFAVKMKTYRQDRRKDYMDSHDGMTMNEYEKNKP